MAADMAGEQPADALARPQPGGPAHALGFVSVGAALLGFVLPAFMAAGPAAATPPAPGWWTPDPWPRYVVAVALAVALELAALVCGITARRTPAGRAGLTVAGIALLAAAWAGGAWYVLRLRGGAAPATVTPRMSSAPAGSTKRVEITTGSATMRAGSLTGGATTEFVRPPGAGVTIRGGTRKSNGKD